jgi:hypothetical protein
MRRTILALLPSTDATSEDALYDVWVSADSATYGDYCYGATYAELVKQLGFAEADPSIVAVRVDRWTWTGPAPERTQYRAAR